VKGQRIMTARISIDGNLVADPDFGVGDSPEKVGPAFGWPAMNGCAGTASGCPPNRSSTTSPCSLFGSAAETAANDLSKGDRVSIEGRPQLETFERRDGSAGAVIKVYARKALKVEDSPGVERPGSERDLSIGDPVVQIDDRTTRRATRLRGTMSAAHRRLTPGIYSASSFGDGVTSFEATEAAPARCGSPELPPTSPTTPGRAPGRKPARAHGSLTPPPAPQCSESAEPPRHCTRP